VFLRATTRGGVQIYKGMELSLHIPCNIQVQPKESTIVLKYVPDKVVKLTETLQTIGGMKFTTNSEPICPFNQFIQYASESDWPKTFK
jgi:bisphosphoglycerate-independent phosphoglycerate mutase (AlkP superfamily)